MLKKLLMLALLIPLVMTAFVLKSAKYERRAEAREASRLEREREQAMSAAVRDATRQASHDIGEFLEVAELAHGPDALLQVHVSNDGTRAWVRDFVPTSFVGHRPMEYEGVVVGLTGPHTTIAPGDRMEFKRIEVTDWGLVVNGVGYGFYSVHALAPYVNPKDIMPVTADLPPQSVPDWAEIKRKIEKHYEPRIDPRVRFLTRFDQEGWDRAMMLVYGMDRRTVGGKVIGQAFQVWVEDVERLEDGSFTGTPVADPAFGPTRYGGDVVAFQENQIVDWGFVEGGVGYGFLRLRADSETRSPTQTEQLASFLSPELLPEGW